MDYVRIYRDFIRDRMGKPEPEGYFEKHHILPRSLGGSDHHLNLIRLTPEDHFFAHLLLAKIYGGSLWAAVQIMAGAAMKKRRLVQTKDQDLSVFRTRILYGAASRWANKHMRGLSHPKVDKTIYRFRHIDGREVRCRRVEFVERYGIGATNISKVLRGRGRSFFGWFLPDVHSDTTIGSNRTKGERHHRADRILYDFHHEDGRRETCTRSHLIATYGVPNASLSKMMCGGCNSAYGWYLPERMPDGIIGDKRKAGENNVNFNPTLYDFVHKDGRLERMTVWAMRKKYGGHRSSWSKVIRGKSSCLGWRLCGKIDPQ